MTARNHIISDIQVYSKLSPPIKNFNLLHNSGSRISKQKHHLLKKKKKKNVAGLYNAYFQVMFSYTKKWN